MLAGNSQHRATYLMLMDAASAGMRLHASRAEPGREGTMGFRQAHFGLPAVLAAITPTLESRPVPSPSSDSSDFVRRCEPMCFHMLF